MKAVYFQSGANQWKFELDDEEHDFIINQLLDEVEDPEEMLDDSLEVLRDLSQVPDEEMDEEDQVDQTVSVAYIWHYFNNLPSGEGRVDGDVVLVENEDGSGVTVLSAKDVLEEE